MLNPFTTGLSHNKPKAASSGLSRAALMLMASLLFVLLINTSAFAAVSSSNRQAVVYKTSFNDVSHDTERTLDWRRPTAELTFDIPDNDWVDGLELLLSARSYGAVNQTAPLLVRFNDAAPIPLRSRGHGFDARLRLDTSALRLKRNKVTFEYQIPKGQTCLTAKDGTWYLDFKDSFVVIKARSKSRALNINDVKTRLGSPTTAPKSIAILAKGKNPTALQLFAAQGVAMNMETVPTFKTTNRKSDMQIILGRRKLIQSLVRDKEVFKSKGSQIAVSRTRPMQLIITGDTDAEVLTSAKMFSRYSLPSSRRSMIVPSEMETGYGAIRHPQLAMGRTKLSDIGGFTFDNNWAPRPQSLSFSVNDPAATSGRLELGFKIGPFAHPDSHVTIDLNGKKIGHTKLVQGMKPVTLDIPRGLIKGLENRLTLTPDIKPTDQKLGCAATAIAPGFSINSKSALTLTSDFMSTNTDLSKFAATGQPFSDPIGTGTAIVLTANNARDLEASLKLAAHLVKTTGQGWTHADILKHGTDQLPLDKHLLFIGPNVKPRDLGLNPTPKSLTGALTPHLQQNPIIIKSAALENSSLKILQTREMIRGGIAGLYQDREKSGRVVGVITNMSGQDFKGTIDNLLKGSHWNHLEGSVSRWNRDTVLMAQTALPPLAKPKKSGSGFKFPKFSDLKFFQKKPQTSDPAAPQSGTYPIIAQTEINSPKATQKHLQAAAKITLPEPVKIRTNRITLPKAPMVTIPGPTKSVDMPQAPKLDLGPMTDTIKVTANDVYTVSAGGLGHVISWLQGGETHPDRQPKLLVFAALMVLLMFTIALLFPSKKQKLRRRYQSFRPNGK